MFIGRRIKNEGIKLSKIKKKRDYSDLSNKFYLNGSFYIISPKRN